jgi:hypothetical protein
MNPPDRAARFRASPHVHARAFDEELVLLDLQGGSYYGLNEIGAKLWGGLTQGQSVAEIASALQGEYQVSETTLVNDLLAITSELLQKGLLTDRAG